MMTVLTDYSMCRVSSVLRTTRVKTRVFALLLGGSIALAASPSFGQTLPQGPLEQISTKPQVIRAQVELGAKLADEAIAILENTDDPDQLARAKDLVKKSYVLLRFANNGCELRKVHANLIENKLLTMAMDNINAARDRNRSAEAALNNSIPWPETRVQFMSEALEQLRPVPTLAQRAAPLIR
jgi:hypothetical protein